MGVKDKLSKYYTDSYLEKYGDRMAQFQGNIISVKVEEKSILWLFHKIIATVIIKPDRSKAIMKCVYKKNKWFKKPEFIQLNRGNTVIIQGLKSNKENEKEYIEISNVLNLTTKRDLIPVDHSQIKKVQQPTYRNR